MLFKTKEHLTTLPKMSNLNAFRFGVLDALSEDEGELHSGNLDPLIRSKKGKEGKSTSKSISGPRPIHRKGAESTEEGDRVIL